VDLTTRLGDAFLMAHPDDAARLMEGLPVTERAALLGACDPEAAARVVQSMVSHQAAETLAAMEPTAGGAVLARQPVEFATLLLRRSTETARENLLRAMGVDLSEAVKRKLRYPENTVGALMDPLVVALPFDLTVGEALDRAQRFKLRVGYYLYVVDRQDRLVGVISLRELMQAEPASPVASLMKAKVARLSASASREDLAASPYWRHYHRLPVIDRHGTLVGLVRYETMRRVQDESRNVTEAGSGLSAIMALGELYWAGLAGILSGMAANPVGIDSADAARAGKDRDR